MTDLLNRVDAPSLLSRARSHRAAAPLAVGMLGLAISLVRIGVPSIWYDEAATISAATRSWPQLWEMLGTIDAVHGLYYMLLHAVVDVFGYSPVIIRVPSALAAGVGAALTVVLARQFTGGRLPVLAGVIFCLLPRVTWMGTEARSYALSAMLAALLTVVFVRAQRCSAPSASWRWWLLYGGLVVVSCLMFIYLALVVIAHGFTMAWWLVTSRRSAAPTIVRWFVASTVAAAALVPFTLEVVAQSSQIEWIKPLGDHTFRQVFRTQWFLYSNEFAIAGCGLIVFGAIVLATRSRGLSLAAVILPGLIIPTGALLIATELYTPLFTPRYLTMGVPFVAIAIAAGVDALTSRALVVLTIIALVGLAVPSFIEQRQPQAKQDSTWSEVADLIADERAEDGPGTTTAVIYGYVRRHPTATARVIRYSYPDAFEGTIDVTLETPAAETGNLWAEAHQIEDSLDRLEEADVAFLITSIKRDLRPITTAALASIGWEVTEEWNLVDVNVLRYEPSGRSSP
jgi:mannosyltransferase